jgi:hypothetical protein
MLTGVASIIKCNTRREDNCRVAMGKQYEQLSNRSDPYEAMS